MKKINTAFYIALIVSFLVAFSLFGYAYFTSRPLAYGVALTMGYVYIFFLLPLVVLLFLILLIHRIKNFGFLNGIKEVSLNVFSCLLGFLILKILMAQAYKQGNQIQVQVTNKTEYGLSNIKIVGRNARTDIDTLAPERDSTVTFYGRNINYEASNDFENEVKVLYYLNNEWKEELILKDFGRWRVFNDSFKIKIFSDSINVTH